MGHHCLGRGHRSSVCVQHRGVWVGHISSALFGGGRCICVCVSINKGCGCVPICRCICMYMCVSGHISLQLCMHIFVPGCIWVCVRVHICITYIQACMYPSVWPQLSAPGRGMHRQPAFVCVCHNCECSPGCVYKVPCHLPVQWIRACPWLCQAGGGPAPSPADAAPPLSLLPSLFPSSLPSLPPPPQPHRDTKSGWAGPGRARQGRAGTMTETTKTHVILLACGSFNPITKGHIQMFG